VGAVTPEQAILRLWRAGDLSWQLHEVQELMRADICAHSGIIYVINCSRRLGKSRLACTLAIEQCLQKPGSQVRYAAPTGKDVRKIVAPHMRDIMAECPDDMRPSYNSQDHVWTFPNGSQIHVAGVNNEHADDLRGVASDLCLVDEAGFVDDLDYLVRSVLLPQTMTTQGRIVLLSTPPVTPAHPFVSYCARAELDGAYSRYTIHDAPHISPDIIETYCAEAGGEQSTAWRREYLCEFVADDTLSVLPEFPRAESAIVEERERPRYYVPIIVGDLGYHDLTFVLFGYHDFAAGVDVIEAEYVTSRTVARDIDAEVRRIAAELWGDRADSARRYADAPPMVIAEMPGWTGIAKTQTDGHWKSAVINDVRTRLGEHSTRIHPRCEQLRAHCRYAVWREPGRMLERMAGFGHFDGVAALAYFTRLVDRHTNPGPRLPAGVSHETHWIPDEMLRDDRRESLRGLVRGARNGR
jgi:hypothetical protein